MLMRDERSLNPGTAFLVVVLAGLVGNILGAFLGAVFPEGALHDLLSRPLALGIDPPLTINLWIVSFSFGFMLKLNSCSLMAMILGLFVYKKA